MDTYNEPRMATRKELQNLKEKKLVVGVRQLKKAVLAGQTKRVYLAKNADPAITEPIAELCCRYGVEALWACSMDELGRACGIEVGATAAAAVE